jgi:hypothetical protein
MNSNTAQEAQPFSDILGGNGVTQFPISNRAVALDLVRRGFAVFPCRPDNKAPLITGGFHRASCDPDQVNAWWRKWPDAIVGLPCGRMNGIAVLDLDRHHSGQNGIAALTALGIDPATASPISVTTPSNGRHLYFRWPSGLTCAAHHLPDGIDIRAQGGYVIAPGCAMQDGRRYGSAVIDLDALPPFPDMLKPPPRPVADLFDDILGDPVPPFDPAMVAELLTWIDPDEEYHDWVSVGMALHHGSQGSDAGLALFQEWSACGKKYSGERDCRAKWRSFRDKPGAATMGTLIHMARERGHDPHELPDSEFGDYGAEPPQPLDRIAAFNQTHAVVAIGGKTRVVRETPDGLEFWPIEELSKLHEADRVKVAGSKRTEPFPRAWVRSKRARRYIGGVTFNPAGARDDQYNLWRGWAVDPDASASCDLFLDHLRTVICAGDDSHYQWLLAWMAHLVQRPQEKPGTAVVLKGAKGAGKDTVGRYLGALFPQNHITLAQPDHLTGRFNGHMAQALLLHLEEGLWAGDKAGESVLKNLITAESIQIERKGIDPIEMRNFARLLITSNADWVVPATQGERRFFVLNVSESRAKDTGYFAGIDNELKAGGGAALLHYLRKFDLTHFDIRNPPETEALTEQKLHGLRNVEAWWHERLYDGRLNAIQCDDLEFPDWEMSELTVDLKQLHAEYAEWMAGQRYNGSTLREQDFGRSWRRLIGGAARSYRKRVGKQRLRCVIIPALPHCRDAFATHVGGSVSWH